MGPVAGARQVGRITLMMRSKGIEATLDDITTAWTSVRQQVRDAGLQIGVAADQPARSQVPDHLWHREQAVRSSRTGTGPQVMATVRRRRPRSATPSSASPAWPADNITAVLRHHSRNPHRPVDLPHEA